MQHYIIKPLVYRAKVLLGLPQIYILSYVRDFYICLCKLKRIHINNQNKNPIGLESKGLRKFNSDIWLWQRSPISSQKSAWKATYHSQCFIEKSRTVLKPPIPKEGRGWGSNTPTEGRSELKREQNCEKGKKWWQVFAQLF